mmetsp:Transcript_12038/g.32910  ORF Transcript_12038/g.32910 Transcript_12038/m.32910 type:complete len:108 (+) Transcript_12038:256-579(+)
MRARGEAGDLVGRPPAGATAVTVLMGGVPVERAHVGQKRQELEVGHLAEEVAKGAAAAGATTVATTPTPSLTLQTMAISAGQVRVVEAGRSGEEADLLWSTTAVTRW